MALAARRKHAFDNSFLVTLDPVTFIKQTDDQDVKTLQLNTSLLQDSAIHMMEAILVAQNND